MHFAKSFLKRNDKLFNRIHPKDSVLMCFTMMIHMVDS